MNKFYYTLFIIFFFSISCKYFESEESKVNEVCKTYMAGRRALESGDSLLVKSVTGDTLYKLMMLNQQYLKLLKSTLGTADLNIYPKTIEIKGTKATCIMSGMEYYKLNLYKTKDKWVVNGENDRFPSTQAITSIQKKIDDYKAFLNEKPKMEPVTQAANRFFMAANNYFKNNDTSLLKNNCNDATLDFVKRLYAYAKKRSGSKVITEEVNKPYSSAGEIKLDGDKATYQFYQENASVLLQKNGNHYTVIGFNGMESKSINEQIMENQYIELLRSVRLLAPENYRNKDIK